MTTYGYCRISRKTQNIERQIRNIKAAYPDAVIIQEAYTGTKMQRKEWCKLVDHVRAGDLIVFDSVSRMSRNAEDGFKAYKELFDLGVELRFIKEPMINTETFKTALSNAIPMTGTNVDYILEGINRFLMELAKEQIKLAFGQAEKEVEDLHERTKEGMITARLNGKQIGRAEGAVIISKKSIKAKEEIKKYSKDFNGSLDDPDVIRLVGVSRNTYYKYKAAIKEELQNN